MTIDEAIKHCEEKAKEIRWQAIKERMDIEGVAECETCAEEHEQLAEWLKELKALRESKSQGEWQVKDALREGFYICSNCGEISCCKGNFCPDCGARMRGSEK